MKNNYTPQLLFAASCLLFSTLANAALINRGNGLIYDDTLDVTWMQNAGFNIADSNNAQGLMNFQEAENWVSNLTYAGFDDWRMPNVRPLNDVSFNFAFSFDGSSDRGFNGQQDVNELSHMFHNNLNNTSYFDESGIAMQAGSENFNTSFIDGETGDLFSFLNVGLSYYTNLANDPIFNAAWAYNFRTTNGIATGESQLLSTSAALSVWAVRDGDVMAVVTPPTTPPGEISEPASLGAIAMLLTAALGFRRRFMV